MSPHIYHREISPDGTDSLSTIARHLRPGTRLLDVGTGTGALGRYVERLGGCTIDGVNYNAEEIAQAAPHYRRIECADLETADLGQVFAGEHYDTIICADILEHLRDPGRTLDQLRGLLGPDGQLLVATPNIGYVGVVAGLLAGRFDYRDAGLLDRTHVRFFTRQSLAALLQEHGFQIAALTGIDSIPVHNEFRDTEIGELPPAVRDFLRTRPDALAYQFFALATAGAGTDHPEKPDDAGAAAENRAEPLPLEFQTQLYWSADGCHFAESASSFVAGHIGSARQHLRHALPGGRWAALRWDPADRAGTIDIFQCRLVDASGRELWALTDLPGAISRQQAVLANARLLPGTADAAISGPWRLIALNGDPWLRLPLPAELLANAGGPWWLETEISWPRTPDAVAIAAELAGLETRIAELGRALAGKSDEAWHLRELLAAEVATNAAAQAENARLAADLHRLSSDNQRLAGEIRELLSSRSWQLTRPLRDLIAILRRLRRS